MYGHLNHNVNADPNPNPTLGLVIWLVKIVLEMTYNVFSRMLNTRLVVKSSKFKSKSKSKSLPPEPKSCLLYTSDAADE